MLTKFWEKTGESLSARWLEYLFGPAFLFWGGGLVVLALEIGFDTVWGWISSRDALTQAVLLVVGALVIALSSKLMEQLRFPFLRLLEGYWPWPLRYLAAPLSRWQWQRIERQRERWNVLKGKEEQGNLSLAETRELARLEMAGHYAPPRLSDCLPTRLGNTLRAAEVALRDKYGLDAIICWPRLWLLLPAEARQSLAEVRQSLDMRVELWAWGLLFLLWTVWQPWAAPVAVLWMWGAYALALEAARVYADLFEAAFDLYRWRLYEAARWEVPSVCGAEEVALGQRLTEFLWRGTAQPPVRYHKG